MGQALGSLRVPEGAHSHAEGSRGLEGVLVPDEQALDFVLEANGFVGAAVAGALDDGGQLGHGLKLI